MLHTQIPYCDNAYCKFEIVAGEDWQVLDGIETGITQVSRQSQGMPTFDGYTPGCISVLAEVPLC